MTVMQTQVLATDGSGGLSWADPTAGLSNTGVTAGTYGNATKSVQLTIDAQGRITSVQTSTYPVAVAVVVVQVTNTLNCTTHLQGQ